MCKFWLRTIGQSFKQGHLDIGCHFVVVLTAWFRSKNAEEPGMLVVCDFVTTKDIQATHTASAWQCLVA